MSENPIPATKSQNWLKNLDVFLKKKKKKSLGSVSIALGEL